MWMIIRCSMPCRSRLPGSCTRWSSPREPRRATPGRAAPCATPSSAAARRCPASPAGPCLPARSSGRSHAATRAAAAATASAKRRSCATETVMVERCVSGLKVGCAKVEPLGIREVDVLQRMHIREGACMHNVSVTCRSARRRCCT